MATTTFNDLITFSRGSNATVTGPNGLIQWAPANLLTNSQDFEAAAWTKISATVTANSSIAPDSSTTADTITASAASSGHYVFQSVTTVAGAYTFTTYAKYTNNQWVALRIFDGTSSYFGSFDIQNGVAGAKSAAATTAITPVGNGWYRIAVTATVLASASSNVVIALNNSDSASIVTWTATGTETAFIWGAQLELGSTATTYNNTSVRNLLGFSEAFDNAAWTKTRASMITGAQANPVNGLFNAQKLMEDTTASSTHILSRSVTASASIYNYSIYAKAAERSVIRIRDSVNSVDGYFNLATGVASNATNATLSIMSIGNGWYRCSVTSTATVTNPEFGVRLASAVGADTYTGDGNSGVYIYGAMLSNSASLDPYVPTPGAAPSSTAYYGPRFDYDPVTLAARGFLVEEARTNLLTYSEQFDNAAWTKGNTTVVANSTTAPDGTTTADTVTPTATSGTHLVRQVAANGALVCAQTVFYKPNGYTKVAIREDFVVGQYASFDCTGAGSVINKTAAATASITAFPNGWYRLTLVPTTALANQGMGVYVMADGYTTGDPAGYSFSGNGTSGGFIWGAQLEAGAFATSYIPTIASTVTRSADVATITGSLFSQWYNQQTGSFIAEWAINNANSTGRYIVKAFSPSVAQGYGLWLNSNSIDTRAWIGATSITAGNASLSITNRAAFGYQAANNAASVNGAVAVASSATGPTDATYLEIGSAGASYFNGWLRSIRYVPVRAADFQLQALTELPLVPTLDLDFLNSLYEA
jgi:hypothetical protein